MFCLTLKNSKSLAVRPSAQINSAGFASIVFYYVMLWINKFQSGFNYSFGWPCAQRILRFAPFIIRDKSQACNMRFCASGARHSSIGQLQICTSVSADGETPGNHTNNVLLTINVISVFSRRISNIPPAQSRFRCTPCLGQMFYSKPYSKLPRKLCINNYRSLVFRRTIFLNNL